MNYKYKGDSRYERLYKQMQLLGIEDVTTKRQDNNGTIVWRLPILSDRKGKYLEYASFESGYVRNQGVDCRSNWQINKCEMNKRYYEYPDGKVHDFDTKERILIPIEIDRLEYMMKYVIKNEFIKRANTVQTGDFVPKWKYEQKCEHNLALCKKPEVKVIIDGQRYNVI
jgi:hypothetical protein|tara:strand:- start:396 stop:902 length:507 start_codon:yes stop_codon:yes gene_type:complete